MPEKSQPLRMNRRVLIHYWALMHTFASQDVACVPLPNTLTTLVVAQPFYCKPQNPKPPNPKDFMPSQLPSATCPMDFTPLTPVAPPSDSGMYTYTCAAPQTVQLLRRVSCAGREWVSLATSLYSD